MMNLGNDILKGTTVRIPFNTNGADGASITIGTNGTPFAIVDGSTTEVTTGVSLSEDFDSRTGMHFIAVDTSQSGFTIGSEVLVGIHTNTIDSKTVNAWVGRFGIQMANQLMPVIGLAQGGTSTTVRLPSTASSSDGAYPGALVFVQHASGAVEIFPQSTTAYVGSTRTLTIDGTFATTPDTTSYVAPLLGPVAGTTVLPNVNTAQINDTPVQGTGVGGDLWRGA